MPMPRATLGLAVLLSALLAAPPARAQLGIEIGLPRRFVFFVRAGLSYVRATAHGTATASTTDGTGQVVTVRSTLSPPRRMPVFSSYRDRWSGEWPGLAGRTARR